MPSKKQSAAKPPDGTVFFIDRSLGVDPIRTELIKVGLVVEINDDHFARDEEDSIWLRKVGDSGWVVLTKDKRIKYRPMEAAALKASNARVFVLTAGNLRGCEIAAVFVKALPRISTLLHKGRLHTERASFRSTQSEHSGGQNPLCAYSEPHHPNPSETELLLVFFFAATVDD